MSNSVDKTGAPLATSSSVTMLSKYLAIRCRKESLEFFRCKKNNPNPEKCLHQSREVSRCFVGVFNELHKKCTKEFDVYTGCLDYHKNDFNMCRKEQADFEKACPLL